MTPTVVGTNLEAKISVDERLLTGTMKEFVTATTSVDSIKERKLTTADNGHPLPVVVTLDLPFATGNDNGTDAETTSLNLSSLTLNLEQTDASLTP